MKVTISLLCSSLLVQQTAALLSSAHRTASHLGLHTRQQQSFKRMRRASLRLSAADASDSHFCLAVLGDLHLDPARMEDHLEARDHITSLLSGEAFLQETSNVHIVSLGQCAHANSSHVMSYLT
jgi:hypothetical protein